MLRFLRITNLAVINSAEVEFGPGLNVLTGNLGTSVIKTSSIPADRHVIEAPARVFHSQEELQAAFKAGALNFALRHTAPVARRKNANNSSVLATCSNRLVR